MFIGTIIKHPDLKVYFDSEVSAISSYGNDAANATTIQLLINYTQKKFIELAKMHNKKVEDININDWNFDAFGAAYEEFKTNEVGLSGKHSGQHFTPIDVKKYIIGN